MNNKTTIRRTVRYKIELANGQVIWASSNAEYPDRDIVRRFDLCSREHVATRVLRLRGDFETITEMAANV